MIGHGLGAAGGLEAIATIKAINTGWLHPTINQDVFNHNLQFSSFQIFLVVFCSNFSNAFWLTGLGACCYNRHSPQREEEA